MTKNREPESDTSENITINHLRSITRSMEKMMILKIIIKNILRKKKQL